MSDLWIDTRIVYEPGRKLAYAYNRAMEDTSAEWVLFIDHDVYLCCNPYWYTMSLDAVRKVQGEKVGWITAKTNRIGCKAQLHAVGEDSDDLNHHIAIAQQVYKQKGDALHRVNGGNFSGFFILTNKTAWKAVGGFRHMDKGLSAIDVDYCRRLRREGFSLYVMSGLYMYHYYKKRKKWLYNQFKNG